jgi:hypothetical protein
MQGGPVTSKGKTRGLLQAWGSFFDRELRAAEKLGLVRRARRTQTPVEWLESLGEKEAPMNDDHAPDISDADRDATEPTDR